MFGISELALLIIVVIVLFGAKKLPELSRSLGKSARILKSEAKAMKSERSATPATHPEGSAEKGPGPRTIQAAPGDVTSSRPVTEPGSADPASGSAPGQTRPAPSRE